ncbi:MAG TPA: hypothetical protein VNH11_11835 [Pirellulales bacterium]|nr:hypothetical protein [Pirellulales bacterium]
MSHREEVLAQAMALPAEDRAYVVTVLERSLSGGDALTSGAEVPGDGISGDALLSELERRSAAYHSGTTTARPVAELLAELKARQASESSA